MDGTEFMILIDCTSCLEDDKGEEGVGGGGGGGGMVLIL